MRWPRGDGEGRRREGNERGGEEGTPQIFTWIDACQWLQVAKNSGSECIHHLSK